MVPLAADRVGGVRRERRERRRLTDEQVEKIKQKVRNRDRFRFTRCQAHNILIVGASRSGKTTLFAGLADPCHVPQRTSLFSDPFGTVFNTYTLSKDSETGGVYEVILTVIDTPGTFEIRCSKDQLEKRSNDDIRDLIVQCINNEVCYLNMVVLVVNSAKFSTQEMDSVELFVKMFGESNIPMLLCLTHADYHNDDRRDEIEQEIRMFPTLEPYFQRNVFRVIWSGCANHRDKNYTTEEELEADYDDVCYWRESLINEFFEAKNNVSLIKTNIYQDRKRECIAAIRECLSTMEWILRSKDTDVLTSQDQLRLSQHAERMDYVYKHSKYITMDPDDVESMDLMHTLHTFIETIRNSGCQVLSADVKKRLLCKWDSKVQVTDPK